MEKIICNPGMNHIPTKIFSVLKLQDLKSCKQVHVTWLEFIENGRFYWEHLLQKKFENLEFPSKHQMLEIWRQKMWQFISEKNFIKLKGLTKSVFHPPGLSEEDDNYLQITIARYGSLEDYEILDTIVNNLNPSFFFIGNRKFSEIETNGWTPLHFAANTRSIEIVKFIINSIKSKNSKYEDKDLNPCTCKGFPLERISSFEQTPLNIAVYKNRLHVVKFLCRELNFNPNNSRWRCCSSSTSPLEIAISYHRKDIADFISDHKFEHERVPK